MLVAIAIAVLPVAVIFVAGVATGARIDSAGLWLQAGLLTLASAIPFAFYGLAAALVFRSEAAVSAASGILVVLAFLGNLFVPLSGTLLAVAKFTPLYGAASLSRWPLLEGTVLATDGTVSTDSIWAILGNLAAWTLIFGAICWAAARRTTGRG